MPRLSEPSRELWLFLLQDGGAWTVADLADATAGDPAQVFERVSRMSVCGLVEKLPPLEGNRRLRYAVTGLCAVPLGMRVAEVQA